MGSDYQKNISAVVDYTVDWSDWLGTDVIVSANWHYPTGITAASHSATTTAATVFLTGGSPGAVYQVTNQIWTSAGRCGLRAITVGCW